MTASDDGEPGVFVDLSAMSVLELLDNGDAPLTMEIRRVVQRAMRRTEAVAGFDSSLDLALDDA